MNSFNETPLKPLFKITSNLRMKHIANLSSPHGDMLPDRTNKVTH